MWRGGGGGGGGGSFGGGAGGSGGGEGLSSRHITVGDPVSIDGGIGGGSNSGTGVDVDDAGPLASKIKILL